MEWDSWPERALLWRSQVSSIQSCDCRNIYSYSLSHRSSWCSNKSYHLRRIYIEVPQHSHRPVSAASSNMSNQKRRLENSNRRDSSSTLNSGSAMQQSQDSFSKKQEIFSIGSESCHSSFQSSLHSHRTSRDSLGVSRRTKAVNPSLSSVSSASTETADRHQTTPFLPPQLEEVGFTRKYERPSGSNSGDTYVIL